MTNFSHDKDSELLNC